MKESLGEDTWSEILDSWRESGLGQAEFCRINKIKSSAFYYWRKRLDVVKQKPKKKRSKNLHGKKGKSDEAEFIEIPMSESPQPTQTKHRIIRFTTSYGAVMEFPL